MTNACLPINEPTDTAEEVLPYEVPLTLTSAQGNSTAVWMGTITAVNNAQTPTVDLTKEYQEKANEHRFFYTVSGDAQSRVTSTITDRDGNNLPLGLAFNVATTGAALHFPAKISLLEV